MNATNPLATAPALLDSFAKRYEMNPQNMVETLKATAFNVEGKQVSDAQMLALILVANEYQLNPFTKEIYAYPDKNGGIVPVVGVDGWTRIINQHPQLDGIEFRYSENLVTPTGGKPCPEWCEVIISRSDRTKPVVVREYLDEVYRPPFTKKEKDGKPGYTVNGPWQSHTKRMLRHKVLIQGSRIGFGFAGIYDPDEAEVINLSQQQEARQPATPAPLPMYPQEQFDANVETWRGLINTGRGTPQTIIATVSSRYQLSEQQRETINGLTIIEGSIDE